MIVVADRGGKKMELREPSGVLVLLLEPWELGHWSIRSNGLIRGMN